MQLLRKIAYPIAILYGLVVHLRNYLYDIGLFGSSTFVTPSICVGNLSVGGTGKTPMIEYLIRALSKKYSIAVLSRGYRRTSQGFLLANPHSTVEALGDEPFQIYKNFPAINVAVDANRTQGTLRLEKEVQPDLILLDDAFQHRKVKATCNVLLTAFDNIYSEDTFLPTGTLRDSKNQAKRADIIVVTKCQGLLNNKEKLKIRQMLKPPENVPVLFAKLSYGDFISSDSKPIDMGVLKNGKLVLVTGIANPEPLLQYLKSLTLNFEHLKFADHHKYVANDIEKFNAYDVVLTTQKDFVKLEGKVGKLYYVGVQHQFLNDEDQLFEELIETKLRCHRESLT